MRDGASPRLRTLRRHHFHPTAPDGTDPPPGLRVHDMLVAGMNRFVLCAVIAALVGMTVLTPVAPTEAQTVALLGAGATFAFPLYAKWLQAYALERGVRVTYQPVGSGEGIRRFVTGAADFAGTGLAHRCPDGPGQRPGALSADGRRVRRSTLQHQRCRAQAGATHHPRCTPAASAQSDRPWACVHGAAPGRHLPGEDQDVG